MEVPKGSLTNQVQAFAEATQTFLAQGKQILAAMDQAKTEHHLDKPLLLRITLEKCMELIEDRLLPVLPKQVAASATAQPRSEPAPTPDPTEATGPRIIDDFRNTHPRQRPIARPAAEAADDAPKRQIESFRGTDPRYRPVQVAQSSAPPSVEVKKEAAAAIKPPHLIGPDPATRLKSPPGSRRHIPRFKCRLPLAYDSVASQGSMQRAYTKDIGALGLFIMANRPEKTGQMIKIVVELPGHVTANLQAVVQWTKWVPPNLRGVDQPGFGVKVTNASEAWYQFFMNT